MMTLAMNPAAADAVNEYRAHAPECAIAEAGDEDADHRQPGERKQVPQAYRDGDWQGWVGSGSERHRHHRQGEEHGCQRKGRDCLHTIYHDQELPRPQRQQHHGHIYGEYSAAVVPADDMVHPAFYDQIQPEHADAGGKTQKPPRRGVHHHAVQQGAPTGQRGHAAEGPDMADTHHQRRHDAGAQHITQEIGGHNGANGRVRVTFICCTQSQQRAAEAEADEQQCRRRQKRKHRQHRSGNHDSNLLIAKISMTSNAGAGGEFSISSALRHGPPTPAVRPVVTQTRIQSCTFGMYGNGG
jgi:hypothetical protein